jgi:hypothetical protein
MYSASVCGQWFQTTRPHNPLDRNMKLYRHEELKSLSSQICRRFPQSFKANAEEVLSDRLQARPSVYFPVHCSQNQVAFAILQNLYGLKVKV